MAKKTKAVYPQAAFMVLEATSFHGGFPAYMNKLMASLQAEMQEAGYFGPCGWTFSGGDGYAVPVVLHCLEA